MSLTKISVLHETLACNPSTARVWARGSTGLTHLEDPADAVQFSALMMAPIRLYEELYYCREQGDVDDWVPRDVVGDFSAGGPATTRS